jgi:hypothetical protein
MREDPRQHRRALLLSSAEHSKLVLECANAIVVAQRAGRGVDEIAQTCVATRRR